MTPNCKIILLPDVQKFVWAKVTSSSLLLATVWYILPPCKSVLKLLRRRVHKGVTRLFFIVCSAHRTIQCNSFFLFFLLLPGALIYILCTHNTSVMLLKTLHVPRWSKAVFDLSHHIRRPAGQNWLWTKGLDQQTLIPHMYAAYAQHGHYTLYFNMSSQLLLASSINISSVDTSNLCRISAFRVIITYSDIFQAHKLI